MILMLVVIRDKIYIIRIMGPSVYTVLELSHDKTNKVACASRGDSDFPRHLHCLIRVFAMCSVGSQVLMVSSGRQQILVRLPGCDFLAG